MSCFVNKALVNVGGELAKVVPGRVSTEVDACLAYDTHSIVRKVCLDAELNGQNYVNLDIENANAYPPCLVDMDIEKGNSETPKTNDEDVEKLKIEGPLTHLQKAVQRQISLQIGEKVVQLLMNDSLVSPKFPSRGKSILYLNRHQTEEWKGWMELEMVRER